MRRFRGLTAKIITGIACAMAIFQLYTGGIQALPAQWQRGIHVGFGMVLIFLLFPPSKKKEIAESKLAFGIDIILAVAAFAFSYYYLSTIEEMVLRQGMPNTMDIIMGTIAIFLVIEAVRRTIGWALAAIAAFFLIYALLGRYFPMIISHAGMSWDWIASFLYLSTEGIYGIPIGVTSTFVFLFVLFANAIRESGGDKVISDLAAVLLGRTRGGSGKMTVLMGLLIGMISGSPVADAAAVGSITIPLMKEKGFRPMFAAALTAVAANGGALMPPVMGAAAFIMVEFINWPYWAICGAAILPALLYYFSLYMAADFEAARAGIPAIPPEERPPAKNVLKQSLLIVIPFIVLIYTLGVIKTSPQKAAAIAWITLVLIYVVQQLLRREITLKSFFDYLARTFETGAKGMLTIISTCACAGIIVGIINVTGLGMQLSSVLVELSGGQLLPLLLLTMVASLILGMGLPVTACYIILAVLAAPALVQAGVLPIAAHLFVFYFGVVSGLTPPVALTAYVTAGIAETPVFRTGYASFILGLVAFLVPYVWVYYPAILFEGPLWQTFLVCILCAISAVALAAGIQGYLFKRASTWERALLIAAAILIIIPEAFSTTLGLIALGCTASIHYVRTRQLKSVQDNLNP